MEHESYQPCTWEIVDPGGSARTSSLMWPTDGDGRYGWKGGAGVAAQDTVSGTYHVSVSCGSASVEGSFEVQELQPLQQIVSSLTVRSNSACDRWPWDKTLTLTVENAAAQTVIVSAPGALDWVSFSSEIVKPPASCSGFFPPEAMGIPRSKPGDTLFFDLTRDDVDEIPHVSLEPGESHTWSFCLSSGLEYSSCSLDVPPSSLQARAPLQLLFDDDSPAAESGAVRLLVKAEFRFDE